MKKKLLVLMVLCLVSLLFVACGVSYVAEYSALLEKHNDHVVEWDEYVETAEDGTDSLETIAEIDAVYDGIITKIEEYISLEENMLAELESYVEGIDEESYTSLKELLDDSLEISKDYLVGYEENRMITKANLLYDQYYAVIDDWYLFCDGDSLAIYTTNDEYVTSLETIYNDFNVVIGDDVDYAAVSEEMAEINELVKSLTE